MTETDAKIYAVCRTDRFRCLDIHIKFHKECFTYSDVDVRGYIDRHSAR
jgi:hypothetical protein